MLTGKAKEDFYKFTYPHYNDLEFTELIFDALPISCKNAQIIDWFDSVGLNILLTCEFDFGYQILEDRYGVEEEVKKWYETRELANEAAIKKANEIYNSML